MKLLIVLCCASLCVFVEFRVSAICADCTLSDGTCLAEGQFKYVLPAKLSSNGGFCVKITCSEGNIVRGEEPESEQEDCRELPRPCHESNCKCVEDRYSCLTPK